MSSVIRKKSANKYFQNIFKRYKINKQINVKERLIKKDLKKVPNNQKTDSFVGWLFKWR